MNTEDMDSTPEFEEEFDTLKQRQVLLEKPSECGCHVRLNLQAVAIAKLQRLKTELMGKLRRVEDRLAKTQRPI